ncbi:hypothetical protein Actkin_03355 [Actinokineospora sp. UTMC 2448]|nr:hypothetical protein Actkin_03355 [Actinokineospora sp. UTMC 2448]
MVHTNYVFAYAFLPAACRARAEGTLAPRFSERSVVDTQPKAPAAYFDPAQPLPTEPCVR